MFWRICVWTCAALLLAGAHAPPAWPQAGEAAVETESAFNAALDASRASMMASPAEALVQAEQAEALIPEDFSPAERDTAYAAAWWLQSEALTRLGRPNDADPVAERALARLGEAPAPTKLYADILLSLGRTSKLLGRHGRALDMFLRAYDVYRAIGDTRSEAIALQSVASIYADARQYDRAVAYYTDAIARFQDPSLDLAAFNNLGNALTRMERYEEALDYFSRAFAIAEEMGSAMLEARILNNMASMHVALGQYDEAQAALDQAFARAGDPSGAEWARFLWGVSARVAHGRGDDIRARTLIERTFDGQAIEQTNQHFTEFHEIAARIYASLGDWRTAAAHLQAFKRLEDEAREFAASVNAALVGAQFDFAEQELQIEQLRAERLESDLALTRATVRQRMVIASGVLVVLLLLLIGAFLRQRALRANQTLLERALYEDPETGLPARPALERDASQAARERGGKVTVVALEIDRHTHLEGVLGFAKFAELQTAMARRLEQERGVANVAHVSPGVFGILLEADNDMLARDEAVAMQACFARPVRLGDFDIDVAVTAGIATHEDGELCVKNAVIAVQQARAAHEAVTMFDARRYGDPAANLTLMSRMLAAMKNGDIALYYQPKLNLREGAFLAAEALCRWNDPERGFIPPDAFIPQAEETGHIRAFTEWSIAQVVRDQQILCEAGLDIALSVNISGALVADTNFARKALDLAEKAPGQICFEVTETAMMFEPERAMANFERWTDAGIQLAIDDYGAGYSSLAYLKALPSRELKIDRMFITNIASSMRDRTVVKSTVDLAHNLGLELTAEGVESEEGLAIVKLLGCDWAQGYTLSKAIPLPDLIDFLNRMRAEGVVIETDRVAATQGLRKLT